MRAGSGSPRPQRKGHGWLGRLGSSRVASVTAYLLVTMLTTSDSVVTRSGASGGSTGSGPSPSSAAPSGRTTWLSGAASKYAADGSYGRWRGTPVQISATWVDDPALYPLRPPAAGCRNCGEFSRWKGPLDVGMSPPEWTSWAAEASGVHDGFWRSMFRNLRAARIGKGPTYARPWYEFNGDWMRYSVRPGEQASFVAAWERVARIALAEFPEVVMVLGTAAGGPIDVATMYPDDRLVGALSIDFYNNWPFCSTDACFQEKVRQGNGKTPNSLARLMLLAKAHGDPVIISEWSSQGSPRPTAEGGGGDSPEFIRSWRKWLEANAGSGPGQVFAEIHFNLWPDQFEFFDGRTSRVQPLAAEEYRRLW